MPKWDLRPCAHGPLSGIVEGSAEGGCGEKETTVTETGAQSAPIRVFLLDDHELVRRGVRDTTWHTTMDAAFDEVLAQCHRPGADNFWLTPRHQRTWRELHRRGHAHSLEVWDGETLVGGLFGIQSGGVFNVASLFHLVPHASQVADVDLHERLQRAGATLVDAGGFWYDRSASAGVRQLPRREFLDVLRRVRDDDVRLDTGRLRADRLFA